MAESSKLEDGGGEAACGPPLLQLHDIYKRYGGVHALRGAHLTLGSAPGTVHGLIGENGSGKSTLLGVLSGQLKPDLGVIRIDGKTVTFGGPLSALRHGIVMVPQEIAVAPDLTVAENILLGRRLVRRGWGINWRATRARAVGVLDRLNLDYDPDAPVRSLRPDQRQMVEIARALSLDSRILILDEPTSSLSDDEVGALFATIRRLKMTGVTTLFVSHRMAELFEICDEVTVLRDGETKGSGPIASFTRSSLVSLMVGHRKSEPTEPGDANSLRNGNPATGVALEVRNICVDGAVRGATFEVRAGEVVGIAGLVGAGRSELLEAIFGARRRSAGTISVFGDTDCGHSPRDSISRGIGFLPPDRKEQGVVLNMDIRDNALMVATYRQWRLRRPRPDKYEPRLQQAAKILNLRYSADPRPVATLSGGNQQKVALAKWLITPPSILMLDEPTRGVDVSSKQDIHAMLRAMASRGTAILVSSSENDELLAVCDRIIIMSRGAIIDVVEATQLGEAQLTSLAGGHS